MTISVLMVDDQKLMLEGLSVLLDIEEDIQVCDMAFNGFEAIEKVKQHNPDVVLMDVEMPSLNGIEATKRIRQFNDQTKILMLTTFGQQDYLKQALINGANGFLLKAISGNELSEKIRSVHQGKTVLDEQSLHLLVDGFKAMALAPAAPQQTLLSVREEQILKLMADAMTNKEISDKLSLAEGTVKNYISQIFEKLHVKDRIKAVSIAREQGLI